MLNSMSCLGLTSDNNTLNHRFITMLIVEHMTWNAHQLPPTPYTSTSLISVYQLLYDNTFGFRPSCYFTGWKVVIYIKEVHWLTCRIKLKQFYLSNVRMRGNFVVKYLIAYLTLIDDTLYVSLSRKIHILVSQSDFEKQSNYGNIL